MQKLIPLILLIISPLSAQAEGFFDADLARKGFFSDDQAGIPIKNPGGNITTRVKDSWDIGSNGLHESSPPKDWGYNSNTPAASALPSLPELRSQYDSFDYDAKVRKLTGN